MGDKTDRRENKPDRGAERSEDFLTHQEVIRNYPPSDFGSADSRSPRYHEPHVKYVSFLLPNH